MGARKVMWRFRLSVQETEHRAKAQALRLKRYADVKEVDCDGKQLDQREFKRTQQLFIRLFSTQRGYYRNGHPPGYRDDPILLFNGSVKDQPLEASTTVKVSQDGRSWYAWRTTPSGWTFAVGGKDGTDDMWLYDGEVPPSRYPSQKSSGWTTTRGETSAQNWMEDSDLYQEF